MSAELDLKTTCYRKAILSLSCLNLLRSLFTIYVLCVYQVSVTLENFQDISLPIPGKEDLARLHSSTHQTSLVKAGSCGEAYAPQGWIAFVMEYIKRCVYILRTQCLFNPLNQQLEALQFASLVYHRLNFSWFWGPVVTLQDCLAAFFARDELKGKKEGVEVVLLTETFRLMFY